MNFEVVNSGITGPDGFRTAGIACGIKASGLDLAIVTSDDITNAAGIFTTNCVTAAPVQVSREHLAQTQGRAKAIVVNSGCANACTGDAGIDVARAMTTATATQLGCTSQEVLVASTGVIGVQLNTEKLRAGIDVAAGQLSKEGHRSAAEAIMTTDLEPKEFGIEVTTAQGNFRVGGMAKGAGMIEPNMATMLAFLTTDARIESAKLNQALRESAADTFNAITVDGECSTNDSVFALASGRSAVVIDDDSYPIFVEAFRTVSRKLALDIVRGGEGATKIVSITAAGARTKNDARCVARVLANSLLVKTALHGCDPNWGRLVAAAGRSGVAFDLKQAVVRIGDTVLFEKGQSYDERASVAAAYLQQNEVELTVHLGVGNHNATVWTCDLSADYVQINSEYRT